jgi:hypothetical protein
MQFLCLTKNITKKGLAKELKTECRYKAHTATPNYCNKEWRKFGVVSEGHTLNAIKKCTQ